MELRTAGNRIGPFRVDDRGPHRAITSDGLPIPHLPQNRPVPAGTLVSVGVASASPEGIGPESLLGPAGELQPSEQAYSNNSEFVRAEAPETPSH